VTAVIGIRAALRDPWAGEEGSEMTKTETDLRIEPQTPIGAGDTATLDQVLAAVEEDLRRDERIRTQIHRELRAMRPRRNGRLVAAAVAVAVVAAAAFALGWNLAPEPATVAAPSVTRVAITDTGLASKRDGLAAAYGPEFGPVLSVEAAADEGTSMPASSLAEKRHGLAAAYGPEFEV
jgi:hypothetical protein